MSIATWTITEARAKFSEVINKAQTKGPQTITRNGRKIVVVVSAAAWEEKVDRQGTLAEFFANSPLRRSGLRVVRMKGGLRRIDL